jgi:hypothetical protein
MFFGDTGDYADSIVARFQGRDYQFWEVGHVLWRPLGWAATGMIGTLSPSWIKGNNARYHVILVLVAISWTAGLATLCLFHRVAHLGTRQFGIASLTSIGFATAQAFLNYSQTGTPYIVALAMLSLAIYFVDPRRYPAQTDRTSALGGVALAAAVLFWLPYLLVVPAVMFFQIMERRALRRSIVTGFSFIVLVGFVYLAVIVDLRLTNWHQIWGWIRAGSHGIQISGVTRAVFGFAQSFINMGDDGILFKRYLLRDKLSPVSVVDLIRLTLSKLALFYTALLSVMAAFVIAKRWRSLLLLAISLIPVLVFAVRWAGGAIERYLPLYPFLFLAFAMSLSEHWPRFQRAVCVGFIAVILIVNIFNLSRRSNELSEDKTARRISEIPSHLLNGASVIFVTHNGDELAHFTRRFPFAPLNRTNIVHVRELIEPGHADLPKWKTTFSRIALTAWAKNGNVWVSQRALNLLPARDWNWVEGDDSRISWFDFNVFFSRLEFGECVGETEGFCLLEPSGDNRGFLDRLANLPIQGVDKVCRHH